AWATGSRAPTQGSLSAGSASPTPWTREGRRRSEMSESASRTWQQQHARMMRAYQRATSAMAVTLQAEDDYYSFFVWCFHLRDWLQNDPAIPKIVGEAAKDFVNTNEALKLCADLANGIKHLRADISLRVDANSKLDAADAAFQPDVFQSDTFQTEERIVVVA